MSKNGGPQYIGPESIRRDPSFGDGTRSLGSRASVRPAQLRFAATHRLPYANSVLRGRRRPIKICRKPFPPTRLRPTGRHSHYRGPAAILRKEFRASSNEGGFAEAPRFRPDGEPIPVRGRLRTRSGIRSVRRTVECRTTGTRLPPWSPSHATSPRIGPRYLRARGVTNARTGGRANDSDETPHRNHSAEGWSTRSTPRGAWKTGRVHR
jgi:hypothetical protein